MKHSEGSYAIYAIYFSASLSIQKVLADTMAEYMKKNKIGFNEVVRRLSTSPSQAAKIQRGEANLTLASFAHFLALMGKKPKDVFKA